MKIQASLIAYLDTIPPEVHPAFWTVDGSEEQIYWKLRNNILHLIAAHNVGNSNTDIDKQREEIKRLQVKYNLGEYPKA